MGEKIGLFLDLDGVIAAIEQHPDLVVATPDRTQLLTALMDRLEGRLAIISGRTIAEIDRICAGAVVIAAGVHGVEMRTQDGPAQEVGHALPPTALEMAQAFAAEHPGIYLEDKGVAAAIHYRDAPWLRNGVQALARELAREHGLFVQSGHFVEEIRVVGPDKGDALKQIMSLPAFSGSTPVMLGDDQTDEAGFVAATALGGVGIRVAPSGPTLARFTLTDVDEVAAWLSAFAASEEGA